MQEPSEFLAAIRAAGVLSPDSERALTAWATASSADTAAIAKHIHEHGWLTPYQIQRIHAGKGNKLAIGPYTLIDVIGEGGMGRVYRARHSRMGREVALKVIRKERLGNPTVIKRFQQEVRAVGQMVHPNIVLAFDADSVGGTHYVAMELIDGTDLKQMVLTHGPMPMHIACEYVRQAALGLQHAFEHGMVHRDIKPSNLVVTREGVVKVLDFGLAMLHEPDKAEPNMTIEGGVLGTPDFLAPEQATNPHSVDTRADVYALGGTLFFFLTGKIPYEAPTMTAKVMKHVHEPPPSVRALRPDLPPQLDALIQWLMAKKPEHRAQVPLQAAAALQPFCVPPMPIPANQPASLILPQEPPSHQSFRIPDSDEPSRRRKRNAKSRGGGALFTVAAIVSFVIVVAIAVVVLKKVKF